MVEIADVVDQKSLEAYLEGLSGDAGLLTARRVAFLAAARVAPIAFREFAENATLMERDLTVLPILGALSISGVASTWPTPEIAQRAADAVAVAAFAANASDTAANAADADAVAVAAGRAANAAFADAAADAAFAADAAADAAYAAADVWEQIRADLTHMADDPLASMPPLWATGEKPDQFAADWTAARALLENDTMGTDWRFWITWYERVLAGKDLNADLMAPILNELDQDDWLGDPAKVNPLFDDVLVAYDADDAAGGSVASPQTGSGIGAVAEGYREVLITNATPVEFTFDDLARVMRMVGIDDDLPLLKDPSIVQNFLDDCEELKEGFQDFIDYAGDLAGSNFAGVLQRSANKILSELLRTDSETHLRARRLVMLATDLENFSQDEKAMQVLGDTLSKTLESRIGLLKEICRKHLGPSYLALAPLSQLRFDQVEQSEVIVVIDRAIVWMEDLPKQGEIGLDDDGMAVFRDMQRELHDFRAAIAEASSDEFRAMLEERFAARSGAMGLSINRFYERSVTAVGRANASTDALIKQSKRVQSLKDIYDILEAILTRGGAG